MMIVMMKICIGNNKCHGFVTLIILMKDAEKGANSIIEVDLENQTIASSDGEVFSFEVDPFKKHCLLNGLDDIGLTMEKEDQITAYESKAAQMFPWA